MADKKPFTFAISLSVLEHLGRHLYRSFATVLGEAISNAWDADATNVWITLDPDKNGFWIKDDGLGRKSFSRSAIRRGRAARASQRAVDLLLGERASASSRCCRVRSASA